MSKKMLAFALVVMVCASMSVTAFASGGGGGDTQSGMDSVLGSMTTLSSLLNSIWDIMTGNPLLALFLAASLLGVGLTLFRRIKRASR